MTSLRAIGLSLCLLALAACTSLPAPAARRVTADALAAPREWTETTLSTTAFELAAWFPRRISPNPELTIYIEGDGLAWLTSDQPSADPTPLHPLALQLALAQPGGNAAYLARPCQFVTSARCSQRYWTQARFAPEVIAASNQAVDELKQRFGARQLILVGYSGGAAVAALLAERRNDVVRLVTVAGNLDHRAWTRLLRLTPLGASLNPADERAALTRLPQWHFVGLADHTVPASLTYAYAEGMTAARVIALEGYDHTCCWAENWPRLWREIR